MLRLKADQLHSFEFATFEREMLLHLRDFAPKHSELLGERGVMQVIQHGIQSAATHGFTCRGPVRLYIELMFMFGSAFATDPLLPWVSTLLQKPSSLDQMDRAALVHDGLISYLDRVVGRNRRPSIDALHRLREFASGVDRFPSSGLAPAASALDLMYSIYPERCQYLGTAPLLDLFHHAPHLAQSIGLSTERGQLLVIIFAFAIGHGFFNDPLFPWIEAVLHNSKLDTAHLRVDVLERRARLYLDRALTYLEASCGNV